MLIMTKTVMAVLFCAPVQLCVLIQDEEKGDVDNDEDCDGCSHLAVSYRRQHRLLASYLEMVQAGADLCYTAVWLM